jgi:hypothetical protein
MKSHFIARGADAGGWCVPQQHSPATDLTTGVAVTPVNASGEEPVASGTKGTIMRCFVLAAMLIVSAVSAITDAAPALGKSMRLPTSAVEVIVDHPLVGNWSEITGAGVVPAVFNADGTVTMRFPDVTLGNHGNAFVSGGTGTWEPVGTQGAVYTVVRPVSHANGLDLGTITIQGYLKLGMDGTTFTDDGRLTIVTTRNARGAISSVTEGSRYAPVITATRIEAGAFEAHGANLYRSAQAAAESTAAISRERGCNTCR